MRGLNIVALIAALNSQTLIAASLVNTTMPEALRYKILAPYFDPAPGTTAAIDPQQTPPSLRKDPMSYYGSITINPPKGTCFIITRDFAEEDVTVCSKKAVRFNISQLDTQGRLTWRISTGKGDVAVDYVWPTPHRLAQVIYAGETLVHNVPLQRCVTHQDPEQQLRRVIITTLAGEKWTITLPQKDKNYGKSEETPNLYIARGGKSGGVDEKSEVGPEEKNKGYDPMLDYEEPKPTDPVTKHWVIPIRNSYVMSSSNFKTADTPPGMKGSCRYRFSGAPKDVHSGWIECHETDRYDVVMTPVTCLGELKP